jgi:hypothetical protein
VSPFPFRSRSSALERKLRAEAGAFAPDPPAALRGRILAAVRAAPAPAVPPAPSLAPRGDPRGTWVALAAALVVLLSAWWLAPRVSPRPAEHTALLFSRELFDVPARVLVLPARAEDNLRLEAARLLSDTASAAEGLVRGLPAPLRERLARL